MTAEEFLRFRHESIHALKRRNEANEKEFRIGSWSRYDYDFDRGTLTFSQDGITKVVASILVAGSTSQSAGTWLWSWANGSLPENVSEPLEKVRNFGISEKIAELAEPYVPDDESLGWQLTAVAVKIMGAKGAYRCPRDNGHIYVIFRDIGFAESPTHGKSSKPIHCNTHGTAYETYVCEHLIGNPGQPWFSQEPDLENPWPDAWCGVCDSFLQEHGRWNGQNEKNIKIRLLCHYCYQALRAKYPRQ
jgi:hypothetical protein